MSINSQKRSFGRGAKVSLFTLGTMRATESLEKMYSIIKNAYYVGINHIETAASYGDAELLIGNSIKKLALDCLLYTSPSPRDRTRSRMPSSA